jgi:hypothetical protein
MSSPLKQNTTTIQDLLNTINSLPKAGADTSDATASANEILQGETAYVNGEKVTGTFSIDDELSTQDDLISQLQSVVDELPEAGGSIETAIVEISSTDASEIGAVFITYENGVSKPEIFHIEAAYGDSDTFPNVVIGSYIYITLGQDNGYMVTHLEGSLKIVSEFTFYGETTRIIVIEVNGDGSIEFPDFREGD